MCSCYICVKAAFLAAHRPVPRAGLNHAGRLYPDSNDSGFAVGAYDDVTDPMG
jgi:hypothetical protein